MTPSIFTTSTPDRRTALASVHGPVVPGGRRARGLGAVLAMTLSALLAGCGNAPDNGQLTVGLNDWIGQRPVCWSVANGASTSFPLRVDLPSAEIDAAHQPILDGLMRGGYITLGRPASQGFAPANALEIALTDKGDDAHVWDPDHGFCVGTRAVDTVQSFTDPEKDPRHNTRVRYTWKLANVPSWATPALFGKVPGLTQPVQAEAVMHRSDGRWQVESEGPVTASSPPSSPSVAPASASSASAVGETGNGPAS